MIAFEMNDFVNIHFSHKFVKGERYPKVYNERAVTIT